MRQDGEKLRVENRAGKSHEGGLRQGTRREEDDGEREGREREVVEQGGREAINREAPATIGEGAT